MKNTIVGMKTIIADLFVALNRKWNMLYLYVTMRALTRPSLLMKIEFELKYQ